MKIRKTITFLIVISLFDFSCNGKTGNENGGDPLLDTLKGGTSNIIESLLQIESEEELKQKFGEKNVTRSSSYHFSFLNEGTDSEVQFHWSDTINHSKLWEVVVYPRLDSGVFNYQSTWRTLNGIRMGMTSDELEKMNGKPFVCNGFSIGLLDNILGAGGDDGYISNWNGGNLSKSKWIAINLFAGPSADLLSDDERKQVEFRTTNISSDNPVLKKVRPRVQSIAAFKIDYDDR